ATLKETIPQLEAAEKTASQALDSALAEIPNLPLDDVPDGKDSNDNVEHHRFGAKRDYAFTPKQHFELGEALGQMDFETAAKLSGARFLVLNQGLARLERALGQFMLDLHTNEHDYTEVAPPLLVRDEVMFGTGQLWKFRDDQFATFTDEFRWKMLEDYGRSAMRKLLEIAERDGIEVAKKEVDARFVRQNAYIPERHWLIPPRGRAPAQSGPRPHPRRSATADAAHRLHAVLSCRGRRRRQGHPRHDPPAPVHQGRAGLDHHAGTVARRARAHARLRRGSF